MKVETLLLIVVRSYVAAQTLGIVDAQGNFKKVADDVYAAFAAEVEAIVKAAGVTVPAQVDQVIAFLPGILKLLGL